MKYATHIQRLAVRLYRMRPEGKRATLRDRLLAERLRSAFERELPSSGVGGIHVYALGGNVTLYGSVRHQLDRELLVQFVKHVHGVRDVVDHLQVSEEG